MAQKSTQFGKAFGSGPVGLAISLILLLIASWFNELIKLPPISNNRSLVETIFSMSILMTLIIFVWSARSLRRTDRGNQLCTTGAYSVVRHPRYAAYLSFFNFGLALYLNSYVYIVWAVLLYPIWHYLVSFEERRMVDVFGEAYIEYQQKTGCFLPKLG